MTRSRFTPSTFFSGPFLTMLEKQDFQFSQKKIYFFGGKLNSDSKNCTSAETAIRKRFSFPPHIQNNLNDRMKAVLILYDAWKSKRFTQGAWIRIFLKRLQRVCLIRDVKAVFLFFEYRLIYMIYRRRFVGNNSRKSKQFVVGVWMYDNLEI